MTIVIVSILLLGCLLIATENITKVNFAADTEYTGHLYEEDGNVITGEGPAATLPYAYKILSYFVGNEAVAELQKGMRYTHLMSNK